MSVAKAALGWLALFVVMFTNGAIRALLLQPRLGEDRARQVASLTGLVLVLAASWVFVRLSPGATPRQLLRVGLGWVAATLAFELLFGRFVQDLSWSALLADYDIRAGRLWLLVVLAILGGPWLWGRVAATRARRRPSAERFT